MSGIYPEVNLRRSNWLVPMVRAVLRKVRASEGQSFTVPLAPRVDGEEFVDTTLGWMRDLNFFYGTALETATAGVGVGRHIFLETVRRQVQVILACRLALLGERTQGSHPEPPLSGPVPFPASLPLEVCAVLGMAEGEFEAAESLHDLCEEAQDEGVGGSLARQLRDPIRRIGQRLLQRRLPDDHPLLDSPFHRLLTYCDTRLQLRMAEELFKNNQVRELRCLPWIGESQVQRLYFVEAIIALCWANGVIHPMERRLIRELIGIGGFSLEEQTLLWQCLDGEPPSPAELAEGVVDPVNRRFLLEQVILASLVDGELSTEEDDFIRDLAAAFEVEAEQLARLEVEVVEYFETRPRLMTGLSAVGMVQRLRRHAQGQVEGIIHDNLEALVTEARETGDLVVLLAKASHSSLTNEETARVWAQLLDICKTIPSLALLAAPGGTILVPVLIKVLPFSLLPTAFEEKDETF